MYKYQNLILNNPRYFNIRVYKVLFSGAWQIPSRQVCLGGLFESWNHSDILVSYRTQDNSKILIFNAGGFIGSNRHKWRGWSVEDQKFIIGWAYEPRLNNGTRFVKSNKILHHLLWEFKRIDELYPQNPEIETCTMRQLVDQLLLMESEG
ncbi:MAG: hypothetical protein LKG19_01075 [Saprospiraceae bacterium]|jgi:hypothetical protein|nr:hypothetical protein [Saprospiraceae bacterium]